MTFALDSSLCLSDNSKDTVPNTILNKKHCDFYTLVSTSGTAEEFSQHPIVFENCAFMVPLNAKCDLVNINSVVSCDSELFPRVLISESLLTKQPTVSSAQICSLLVNNLNGLY